MCIKSKKDVLKNDAASGEDIPLNEGDIENVSGGIKWDDGKRPTLKDAEAMKKRKTKQKQ